MENLTVNILGRDYRLSCEPAERETLLAAVAYVDHDMHAIRDQGRIAGTERIAVFAALKIARELLARRALDGRSDEATSASGSPAHVSVVDPEILRRMNAIDALIDAVGQERLF